MFDTLKYNLLNGWGLLRLLRLALGVFVVVQSVLNYDWLFASLGAILSFQALFNVGCCAGSACYSGKLNSPEEKEITYEEIK
jgi:hypothetical protein